MKNNDDKIKKMYESINTPEYNPKDEVLNKITKQKTVPKINGKVLLVAVMIVILLVATAGVAGAFDHMFIFRDHDPMENMVQPSPTPTPYIDTSDMNVTQETDIESVLIDFVQNAEYGQYRSAFCYDASGMGHGSEYISTFETNDLIKMQNAIKKSRNPMPVPSYIPKAYEFEFGQIDFYLDAEIFEIEPAQWEDNGFNYFVYQLPDDFDKNILRYTMLFSDKNDNEIAIYYEFNPSDTEVFDITLDSDIKAEYIEIEGCDDAVLINVDSEYTKYAVGVYSAIEPFDNVSLLSKLINDKKQRETTLDHYKIKYGSAIGHISASDLSEKEIIKVAEGLY